MRPIYSRNQDFFANAPPDNRKPLFTVLPLWYDNYNFTPTSATTYLFMILPLPRAGASFYIELSLEFGMLQTQAILLERISQPTL